MTPAEVAIGGGLIVTSYGAALGAALHLVRKQRHEREAWQRQVRRRLDKQARHLRKIDTKGTFGSRGRTLNMQADVRKIADAIPGLVRNVDTLAVELENTQEDVREIRDRLAKIEDRIR